MLDKWLYLQAVGLGAAEATRHLFCEQVDWSHWNDTLKWRDTQTL